MAFWQYALSWRNGVASLAAVLILASSCGFQLEEEQDSFFGGEDVVIRLLLDCNLISEWPVWDGDPDQYGVDVLMAEITGCQRRIINWNALGSECDRSEVMERHDAYIRTGSTASYSAILEC